MGGNRVIDLLMVVLLCPVGIFVVAFGIYAFVCSTQACDEYQSTTPFEKQTLKGWFKAIFRPAFMVVRFVSAIIKLVSKGWDGQKQCRPQVYYDEDTKSLLVWDKRANTFARVDLGLLKEV